MNAARRFLFGYRFEYERNANNKRNNTANPERNINNNRHLSVSKPIVVKTTICIDIISQNDPDIIFLLLIIYNF
jgi:hypothetical protein